MNNTSALVINSGSSSLKLTLFSLQGATAQRLLDAHLHGLETEHPVLDVTTPDSNHRLQPPPRKGVAANLQDTIALLQQRYGLAGDTLQAIGHRFVHGGSLYHGATLLDDSVLTQLEDLAALAPLHNGPSLEAIHWCRRHYGAGLPQWLLFDTAFHSTMPPVAANYAIPQELVERHNIKRYGFHGLSHAYLWQSYRKAVTQSTPHDKIITLHLGNGCSACAIDGGRSIDTSMGFSPAEGLVMATRAGDIDAAVLPYLCLRAGLLPDQVMEILNYRSGLKGLSAKAADMKTLLRLAPQEPLAQLAVDMFCYRVVKYIGAYMAALQGCDAIVFSGGIGENAAAVRQKIADAWRWMGIVIDAEVNAATHSLAPGDWRRISGADSAIPLYVIATDENQHIADELRRLLRLA